MKWLVLNVGIALILILLEAHVEGSPGRKNKKKDGSIFDNKIKNNLFNNNNPGLGSGTTYKKKGGAMKTLKKAAVIGKLVLFRILLSCLESF